MPSPLGRDRSSYKEQRRRTEAEAARKMKEKAKQAEDDGMFFGTSPTERKDLRETVDKRKIDLKKLNLDALDREKFNAPEKVGDSVRLIDMAMADSAVFRPDLKKLKQTQKLKSIKAAAEKKKKAAEEQAARRAAAKKRAARRARPAAKKGRPPAKRRPPQPKPTGRKPPPTGKGVKLEDLGLKAQPRRVGKKPPQRRPRGRR